MRCCVERVLRHSKLITHPSKHCVEVLDQHSIFRDTHTPLPHHRDALPASVVLHTHARSITSPDFPTRCTTAHRSTGGPAQPDRCSNHPAPRPAPPHLGRCTSGRAVHRRRVGCALAAADLSRAAPKGHRASVYKPPQHGTQTSCAMFNQHTTRHLACNRRGALARLSAPDVPTRCTTVPQSLILAPVGRRFMHRFQAQSRNHWTDRSRFCPAQRSAAPRVAGIWGTFFQMDRPPQGSATV